MTVPETTLNLLKLREGFEPKVYRDSLGIPTAGCGHKLLPSERAEYAVGDTVPDATLSAWLQIDSIIAYSAALSQSTLLRVHDLHFIDVLTSVNYQLGTRWMVHFPLCWAALMKGDWGSAAVEAGNSLWATQTPVRARDFQQAILSLKG